MAEVSETTPLHSPASPSINVAGAAQGSDSDEYPLLTEHGVSEDSKDCYKFSLRGNRVYMIGARRLNIILTALTILTNLMMVVSLPLLNNTVDKYNDFYPVILYSAVWFQPFFFGLVYLYKYLVSPGSEIRSTVPHKVMALLGLLNAINGILIVYSADPRRTPGSLQALLSTSSIPFTVAFRYILLRKGVGRGRLVCTGIVLVGLFIALEPEIFNIGNEAPVPGAVTGVMRVVWPILFLLGFLPLGILNVLIERELKKDQTESLVFLAWVQFYNFVFVALLFWTDFIPDFGAADNFPDFLRNMFYSLKCMYYADPQCITAAPAYIVFILAYCLANLMIFLLVKFAEGAIWLVLVQSLVTPLGSVFFALFSVDPLPGQEHGKFHWAPEFGLPFVFRVLGLLVLVPTVAFYNYFGEQERKEAKKLAEQTTD